MDRRTFFFAGGGTGGHIYPAIAIAEQLRKRAPEAKIHFFCSTRDIDTRILSQSNFEITQLPAQSFSIQPIKFIRFIAALLKSCRIAGELIAKSPNPQIIGLGGFVSGPVCLAGHKRKIPIKLLNVDIIPGRANKLLARFAKEIFVQFDETADYLAKTKAKVSIVGCPLRDGFENPDPEKAIKQLGLADDKKLLLITGASSGSQNINNIVCSLLESLADFAQDWQIVHLAGRADFDAVRDKYNSAQISCKVLDYCDDMPDLLAAADLVVGRSGAVSVAEYAASATPSICIPYPYHKDRHQYLNAEKLVSAGAAVIANDLPNASEAADSLWQQLKPLLTDEKKRSQMKNNCAKIGPKNAAAKIAEKLLDSIN